MAAGVLSAHAQAPFPADESPVGKGAGVSGYASTGPGVFHAAAHGARCNGTADDTTAVAATLTLAGVSGGRVILPKGSCITSPLTIPAGVELSGQGRGITILKRKNSTSGNLVTATAANVTLRALTLDGNRANNGSVSDPELFIGNSGGFRNYATDFEIINSNYLSIVANYKVLITDCALTGPSSATLGATGGLWTDIATAEVTIRGCIIKGYRFGGIYAGGYTVIEGNHLESNHWQVSPTGGGQIATGFNTGRVSILNNTIINGAGTVSSGIELDNGPVEAIGNTIAGNPWVGIAIQTGSGQQIIGNYISGNGSGYGANNPGIWINGTATSFVISSNVITGHVWGIDIQSGTTGNWSVTGNIMSGNSEATGWRDQSGGTNKTAWGNDPGPSYTTHDVSVNSLTANNNVAAVGYLLGSNVFANVLTGTYTAIYDPEPVAHSAVLFGKASEPTTYFNQTNTNFRSRDGLTDFLTIATGSTGIKFNQYGGGILNTSTAGVVAATSITGLVLGAGTSAPTAYAGATCTNQFVRSLNASGAATCASVSLTADVSGLLPFANIANGSALSVFGRSANSSGVMASIAASSSSDAVLRESGGVLGFGTIATAGIANNAVTLAKLATQAQNTVLGNGTSGTAVPTALVMPTSCSAAGTALTWTTNTGFSCNTSITAAAVPASGLTGTTLASNVVTSSLATVGTIGSGIWNAGAVTSSSTVTATAASGFYLGASPALVTSTNYNILYDPGGGTAHSMGNATDPTNYSSNTTHRFRSRDGLTNFVDFATGSTGVRLYQYGAGILTTNSSGVVSAATTSAAIASALSDEQGSGALVFATSPTLVTPILGVASASSVAVTSSTAPANGIYLKTTNSMGVAVNGGPGARFDAGGGVPANYPVIGSAAAGGNTAIYAEGASTDIGWSLASKGAGNVDIATNTFGSYVVSMRHVASAVNLWYMMGSATGSPVEMQAQGSDTNIDIRFTPKGSGIIRSAAVIRSDTGFSANGTLGVTCGAGLGGTSRTTLGLVTTC